MRHGLSDDLGFEPGERSEHIRRVAHVARLFADAGVVAVVSLVSPIEADRKLARELHDAAGLDFHEVFVSTPVEECERRDPKGLYARARAGKLPGFTGVDAPYEEPEQPGLRVRHRERRRRRRGRAAARGAPRRVTDRTHEWCLGGRAGASLS